MKTAISISHYNILLCEWALRQQRTEPRAHRREAGVYGTALLAYRVLNKLTNNILDRCAKPGTK